MAGGQTLTRRQLGRATLARQLLLARVDLPVVDVVQRLAGLQAQEPGPPFLGLWTRMAGFAAEDLRVSLHAREVVRATWSRGTLHLVDAADYRAFRSTLQPVLDAGLSVLGPRAEGLDVERVVAVARGLLAEPRTFTQLRAALQDAFPEVHERALGFAVRMCLPLVMVPTAAPRAFPVVASFALAEEWLGGSIAGAPAPEALALRYLAAFGPASAADFGAWSGLRRTGAVLEGLRPRLRAFRHECTGRELFDLPDAPRPDPDVPAPPRYLPEFDNVVLAHADRSRFIADEHRPALVTKNLRVRATFLWDGVVRGTWTLATTRTAAALELAPFEPLPPGALEGLTTEGDALLRFTAPDALTREVRPTPPASA